MRIYAKFIIAITIFTILVILYSNPKTAINIKSKILSSSRVATAPPDNKTESKVSIWISVTKIDRGHLLTKFRKFFKSLISHRGKCRAIFELNVITDNASRPTVDSVIYEFSKQYKETLLTLVHYDFQDVLKIVESKIEPLKRFFQSSKGSYYSDDVFYLSPALHLVAPNSLDKAIVVDVDTAFQSTICDLYNVFDNFTNTQLFGLAPELSPVYHHILWKWRNYRGDKYNTQPQTNLNGLNSGVLLSYLERIRKSAEYNRLISPEWISSVVQKYLFKGHLGDQDWYTLVSYEHPELIYRLSCGWNRQLCTWWKLHGYADTFDSFARCTEKVHLYHGNCDTPIPPK
ncbi:xyloside xylosyltransferase 1 [Metopolophium dirhodum]|uniref:xyloside xylosyltransferase 1 n=1 Tax=Metopolophium dirhodum TaxID=44670 RepID=UPI00298F873B|nr:xyloside xylosyltransferase 1 [Metopolophium dirhodum]